MTDAPLQSGSHLIIRAGDVSIKRLNTARMVGSSVEPPMRSTLLRMEPKDQAVVLQRSFRRRSLRLESAAGLKLQRARVFGDDALGLFVDVIETADLDFQRHVRFRTRQRQQMRKYLLGHTPGITADACRVKRHAAVEAMQSSARARGGFG